MAPQCVAQRKAGGPCTSYATKGSTFCIAHDPVIGPEQRKKWRSGPHAPNLPSRKKLKRVFTPDEIVTFVTARISTILRIHGDTLEAETVIADYLRVAVAANRILQSKKELAVAKGKVEHGPRTVRIVRDEPENDSRVADAS